ncbi:hypothetical protein V6C27_02855 [Peptococcaceae bacterium 1198_IL3148]
MVFSFGSFLAGATVALMAGMAIVGLASTESKCNTCGWRNGCQQLGAEDDCKRNGYEYWEPVE